MDVENQNQEQVEVTCPVCDNKFSLNTKGLEIGDATECTVCGATNEIVNTDPLTLEPVVRGK
jgi:lysine biosynthesis protein LysW